MNLNSSSTLRYPPTLKWIENRGPGRGLATDAFAIEHEKPVVDLLEQVGIAETTEPPMHGAAQRKVRPAC